MAAEDGRRAERRCSPKPKLRRVASPARRWKIRWCNGFYDIMHDHPRPSHEPRPAPKQNAHLLIVNSSQNHGVPVNSPIAAAAAEGLHSAHDWAGWRSGSSHSRQSARCEWATALTPAPVRVPEPAPSRLAVPVLLRRRNRRQHAAAWQPMLRGQPTTRGWRLATSGGRLRLGPRAACLVSQSPCNATGVTAKGRRTPASSRRRKRSARGSG